MDKVKTALTLVSIAIIVGPIAGAVFLYRDNLLGLVVPPQVKSLLKGNSSGSQFQPPISVGEPQYNPTTGTGTLTFNFTNTLTNAVSIDKLSGEAISTEYGLTLGNISLSEPINVAPGETATITASGIWNQQAISQFEAQNPGVKSVNVSLENLNVDVAGINLEMTNGSNVGQLPLQG